MLKSLQNIQKEIKYVIDRTSKNDPLRDHLIAANIKCEKLKDHFIDDGK